MPSAHVYLAFELPPHFLYQAPPGAQQLDIFDFLMVPHLGHPLLGFAVTATAVVVANEYMHTHIHA